MILQRALVICLGLCSLLGYSQSGTKVCLSLAPNTTSTSVDFNGLVTGSIEVISLQGEPISFEVDNKSNIISFEALEDSSALCYRKLVDELTSDKMHRDVDVYKPTAHNPEPVVLPSDRKKEELIVTPGIEKNGSLTRGISVGNAQNVFVNSNLNLQLSGDLTPTIRLEGVISDQNVPFQPEGNTQQLQEFDKVYLKISGQKSSLLAGDMVLSQRDNHFVKYKRNVQGARFTRTWGEGKGFGVAASLSKGKFNSEVIVPLEGIQGPYKLRGAAGERFILVLANSERVFLDGVELTRGWDFDYTIDYNLGEITFNNNHVITEFSVIRADFEYSDRHYSRAITEANVHGNSGALQWGVNYYREKDNPNQPIDFQFDQTSFDAMLLAGDVEQIAVNNSLQAVAFDEGQVLYVVDSSFAIPRFVHSNQDTAQHYLVSFSLLSGGAYVKDNSLINGSVYSYVGYPLGTHDPAVNLVTPKSKRAVGVNLSTKTDTSKVWVNADLALSELDLNLVSSVDDGDNLGFAGRVELGFQEIVTIKSLGAMGGYVSLDAQDSSFSEIDRFRHVNFDREWNANGQLEGRNVISKAGLFLKDGKRKTLSYDFTMREKQGDASGWRQDLTWFKKMGHWNTSLSWFHMNASLTDAEATWSRVNGKVSYKKGKLEPGLEYSHDINERVDLLGVALKPAMHMRQVKAFVYQDLKSAKLKLESVVREDRDTLNGEFALALRSVTSNLMYFKKFSAGNSFSVLGSYRSLDDVLGVRDDENNVMGRLDWDLSLPNRSVKSQLSFASNTGRELKREFVYVPVPIGQGTHIFLDFNGNGLQELDEFVLEPLVGDYAKLFVPTDEYVRSFTNRVNYRINLQAPRSWSKGSFGKIISKFSLVGNWNFTQKSTDSSLSARILPYYGAADLSQILSFSERTRATLFFNRSSTDFGGDLTWKRSARLTLLTNGRDSLGTEEISVNIRKSIGSTYLAEFKFGPDRKETSSDYLDNLNYSLRGWQMRPSVLWQPGSRFRLSLFVELVDRQNLNGGESSSWEEYGAKFRLSQAKNSNLEVSFSLVQLKSNIEEPEQASALSYEINNGLTVGTNAKWDVQWQKRLGRGLQLNVFYQGRKPAEDKLVHLGRMQITALF